jgi:hypothetical protein
MIGDLYEMGLRHSYWADLYWKQEIMKDCITTEQIENMKWKSQKRSLPHQSAALGTTM